MTKIGGRLKAAAGLAGLVFCAAALAQQPVTPQPGRDRPLPEAAPQPDIDFTIQAPRRSPVPRAVEDLTFDVKDVRVVGATRYGQDVLRPLIQPVIGQTVHLSDLIAIAEQIEARYHQDGYVLTRAFVPTQSVADGNFQITVVEGYVAAVAVQGGDESTRARVERMLAPITAARPLTLATLEQSLLSANKLPGVSASGLLRPSATEQGASDLVVTVKEQPIATGGVSADNMGTPSTGRWTTAADATIASPFGDGGQLSVNASTNPADPHIRYSAGGRYVAPLPLFDGMTYTLSALGSHGEPGGTVSNQSLITNSTAFGARVTLPLIVTRQNEVSIDGGLTVQSSDVKISGLTATHDEWRVFDLALTYQNNGWGDGVTNVTLDAAQGIPSLGATSNSHADRSGDTQFTKITGQVRRTQAIDGPLSASLLVSGQYTDVPTVLGEEVNFGGQVIGRGYDPAAITGATGVGGAGELRYDLNPSWFYADAAQVYGFLDGAEVHNHNQRLAIRYDKIASTGAGLRLTVLDNVTVGTFYGKALIGVPGSDKGHRSSRVMVNTAIRF